MATRKQKNRNQGNKSKKKQRQIGRANRRMYAGGNKNKIQIRLATFRNDKYEPSRSNEPWSSSYTIPEYDRWQNNIMNKVKHQGIGLPASLPKKAKDVLGIMPMDKPKSDLLELKHKTGKSFYISKIYFQDKEWDPPVNRATSNVKRRFNLKVKGSFGDTDKNKHTDHYIQFRTSNNEIKKWFKDYAKSQPDYKRDSDAHAKELREIQERNPLVHTPPQVITSPKSRENWDSWWNSPPPPPPTRTRTTSKPTTRTRKRHATPRLHTPNAHKRRATPRLHTPNAHKRRATPLRRPRHVTPRHHTPTASRQQQEMQHKSNIAHLKAFNECSKNCEKHLSYLTHT